MEALSQISITSLTSATHLSFPTRNYPLTPLPATRISFRSSRFRSLIPAKQSYFQGQWRLSNLSLAVVSGCVLIPKEANGGEHTYIGLEYNFQMEDTLLGEGSGNSIVELRPSLVTNLSTVDPFTFLSKSLPRSSSPINVQMSNEESMKAYADLKFSMLLYDAMLVFTGTSVLFSASENAAFAFFIGGMGGFLYLLLLQRSVDGLPAAPSLNSRNVVDREEPFGRFKNPVSSLSLAAAFALLTLKYGLGDSPLAFTPKELVMGMLGFLSCKVAVVLAAWKPMPFHKAKK